jgi:hypothetical protein
MNENPSRDQNKLSSETENDDASDDDDCDSSDEEDADIIAELSENISVPVPSPGKGGGLDEGCRYLVCKKPRRLKSMTCKQREIHAGSAVARRTKARVPS